MLDICLTTHKILQSQRLCFFQEFVSLLEKKNEQNPNLLLKTKCKFHHIYGELQLAPLLANSVVCTLITPVFSLLNLRLSSSPSFDPSLSIILTKLVLHLLLCPHQPFLKCCSKTRTYSWDFVTTHRNCTLFRIGHMLFLFTKSPMLWSACGQKNLLNFLLQSNYLVCCSHILLLL